MIVFIDVSSIPSKNTALITIFRRKQSKNAVSSVSVASVNNAYLYNFNNNVSNNK